MSSNNKSSSVLCDMCKYKETIQDPFIRACQIHKVHFSCWEYNRSVDTPFVCVACSDPENQKNGYTLHLPVADSCIDGDSLQEILDQNTNVDIATICKRYNLTLDDLLRMGLTKLHLSYVLGDDRINQVFTASGLLTIGLTAKIAVDELDMCCDDILRSSWTFQMVTLLGFTWELMKPTITENFVANCGYTDEQWEELGAGSEEQVYKWLNLID